MSSSSEKRRKLGVESEKIYDLRSDTVTKPTPQMRKAMAEAEVGDDVYGEDPTVNLLEKKSAEIMGKEAGLFLPSGTMGNLLALITHCGRGQEVILGGQSHTFYYEVGGASALGVAYHTIQEDSKGLISPEQIETAVRGNNIHYPKTALLALENTHNRSGGTVMDIPTTKKLCDVAHKHHIPVHLDGARIFNAATYLNCDVKDLVKEYDSVQFCLSKGLCAPVGSMLVGSQSFIEKARHNRKMLGGGMRQAGILAAAGLIALTEMPKRLHEDHKNCRILAEGLARIPGFHIDLDNVQTNMVYVDVTQTKVTGADWTAKLKDHGVLINATGPFKLRFVTHNDINSQDIHETLEIVKKLANSH